MQHASRLLETWISYKKLVDLGRAVEPEVPETLSLGPERDYLEIN